MAYWLNKFESLYKIACASKQVLDLKTNVLNNNLNTTTNVKFKLKIS